jgi:hypothetical protein
MAESRDPVSLPTGQLGAAVEIEPDPMLPVFGSEHPVALLRRHLARWSGEPGDAATARAVQGTAAHPQAAALSELPYTLTVYRNLGYWTRRADALLKVHNGDEGLGEGVARQ